MEIKKVLLLALAFMAVSCATGVAVSGQPYMVGALSSLQNARSQLLQAEPNKGGHRDRAIALVDQAIAEVNRGINYADE